MSSPVVFALTLAQCKALDAVTRPGFKPRHYTIALDALQRRYLIQGDHRKYWLTAPGHSAQELVRMLRLHLDGAHQA